jgi:hypothetical protein
MLARITEFSLTQRLLTLGLTLLLVAAGIQAWRAAHRRLSGCLHHPGQADPEGARA